MTQPTRLLRSPLPSRAASGRRCVPHSRGRCLDSLSERGRRACGERDCRLRTSRARTTGQADKPHTSRASSRATTYCTSQRADVQGPLSALAASRSHTDLHTYSSEPTRKPNCTASGASLDLHRSMHADSRQETAATGSLQQLYVCISVSPVVVARRAPARLSGGGGGRLLPVGGGRVAPWRRRPPPAMTRSARHAKVRPAIVHTRRGGRGLLLRSRCRESVRHSCQAPCMGCERS